jgi:hypothetical protein
VDARFDSVPLVSKTNTIAQNKINHGNYVLDYEDKGSVKFDCAIFNLEGATSKYGLLNIPIINANPIDRWLNINTSYVPWGRYTFGVEFVDSYGRTIPVNNYVERYAGTWGFARANASYDLQNNFGYNGANITQYSDKQSIEVDRKIQTSSQDTQTIAIFEMEGSLPYWVEKINIVRSKCLNIVNFNQSVGVLYLWYTNAQMVDELIEFASYEFNPNWTNFTPISQSLNLIIPGKTFQGYVMRFNSGEPFVQKENQYIYIRTIYQLPADGPENTFYDYDPIKQDTRPYKFRVQKIVGNNIYFEP